MPPQQRSRCSLASSSGAHTPPLRRALALYKFLPTYRTIFLLPWFAAAPVMMKRRRLDLAFSLYRGGAAGVPRGGKWHGRAATAGRTRACKTDGG